MNRWPPNFVRQRPGSPLHCPHHHPLIRLSVQLRQLDGPTAIIHTDPAPGFKTLRDDQLLKHHRITLEIGDAKNRNKNPIAERAVQEVESELLRHDPLGGPVNHVTLAVVTANLNACLWTLHGVYSSLVGNDCSIFPLDLCRSSVRSFVFHIGDFSKCIFFLQSYRAILFMLAQFRGGYLEF